MRQKKWESDKQQYGSTPIIINRRKTKNSESTPQHEYDLKGLQNKNIQSEASQQHVKRSLSTKRFKGDSLLYNRMNEKLEQIQSKIQQIKTNIHRKKLDRMKKNVMRSQQLQELKKKLDSKRKLLTDSSQSKQKKIVKFQQSKKQTIQKQSQVSDDQYQVKRKIQKRKLNLKISAEDKNNKDKTNQQIKQNSQKEQIKKQTENVNETNLGNFITQQKSRFQQAADKVSEEKLKVLVTTVPQSHSHSLETNPYSPRSSVYYVSEVIKNFRDKTSIVHEHIRTSIDLFNIFSHIRMPNNSDVKKRVVNMPQNPRYEGKKTVIFDLDQTLIHCNSSLKMEHQIQLPIKFPTGEVIKAGINIRPGAFQILQALHQDFELIVFTASHQCYANVVIDYLDPKKQYIQHRLYREHCYITSNQIYVKDLRILDRDLKNVVLVDNAAYSYAFQPENGIPIIPYYHGVKDFELHQLTNYIKSLMFCPDVRKKNRQIFRLTRYRDYKKTEVDKLVEDLYINKIQ